MDDFSDFLFALSVLLLIQFLFSITFIIFKIIIKILFEIIFIILKLIFEIAKYIFIKIRKNRKIIKAIRKTKIIIYKLVSRFINNNFRN